MSVTTATATLPASPKLLPLPELAAADDGYSVTYMAYESDSGWAVELARPSHLTDFNTVTDPKAADLPVEVRQVLRAWLDAADAA